MQSVSVAVPEFHSPPPCGAAELPLTVQLVIVRMPPWLYRPPPLLALPPETVIPEIDAVTFASTWNTRLALLPETVTAPSPGPS